MPNAVELVKLSQCGGTPIDLMRMEHLIVEKLQNQIESVTSVMLLQYFFEAMACKDAHFEDTDLLSAALAKMEVLLCQTEFAKMRVS